MASTSLFRALASFCSERTLPREMRPFAFWLPYSEAALSGLVSGTVSVANRSHMTYLVTSIQNIGDVLRDGCDVEVDAGQRYTEGPVRAEHLFDSTEGTVLGARPTGLELPAPIYVERGVSLGLSFSHPDGVTTFDDAAGGGFISGLAVEPGLAHAVAAEFGRLWAAQRRLTSTSAAPSTPQGIKPQTAVRLTSFGCFAENTAGALTSLSVRVADKELFPNGWALSNAALPRTSGNDLDAMLATNAEIQSRQESSSARTTAIAFSGVAR